MNNNRERNYSPCCLFLAITIIFVYLFQKYGNLRLCTSRKSMVDIAVSNFQHVDSYHMIGNLLALYSLVRLERMLGCETFVKILVYLIISNTVLERALHKILNYSVPPAIGFSGILYSFFTFEIITQDKIDLILLLSLVSFMYYNWYSNKKSSLLGHGVGILNGLTSGIFYNNTKTDI